ncbi:hypothetical protein NPIL_21491 [Nephila pilipes]|uniref:Uncharacterized protein n=1 Tax=Nephila pilipes TaxID=299642 RepID=A0A8X6Q681_NEPPI|nr:hypothetical protein NPIL_21491 [Nephila pilipes]
MFFWNSKDFQCDGVIPSKLSSSLFDDLPLDGWLTQTADLCVTCPTSLLTPLAESTVTGNLCHKAKSRQALQDFSGTEGAAFTWITTCVFSSVKKIETDIYY